MAIELYIKYPVTLRLNLSSTTSAQNREEEKRGGPSINGNALLLANLSTILDKFFGKKKRKIKILTSTMTTKARIKAERRSLERNGRKNFCNWERGCKFCLRNYRNYDRTYRSETDYSFFFFFTPTMIHYSWTRDFTDKKGTIQD